MDEDEDETKHKPDLNFGVPKNIKKKPILIPAKGEYKFKGSANNKNKNVPGVVKETFFNWCRRSGGLGEIDGYESKI